MEKLSLKLLILLGGDGSGWFTENGHVPHIVKKSKFDIPYKKNNSKISIMTPKGYDIDSEMINPRFQAVLNYAQGLTEYTDEKTGLNFRGIQVTVRKDSNDKNICSISCNICTLDGKKIGFASRIFYPDDDEVYHNILDISENYRNNGFGMRFYAESEKMYKQNGYKKVSLFANLDVGCYTWARVGYRVKDSEEEKKIINSYMVYRKELGLPKIPKLKNLLEVATDTDSNGNRHGKDFLIAYSQVRKQGNFVNGYEAIKYLDDTDDHYQVGLVYYKEKGVDIE